MDFGVAIATLESIRSAIERAAVGGRYFRPSTHREQFERFAGVLDELQAASPDRFGHLTVPDHTPSSTSDFEGEGYLTRSQLLRLRDEVSLASDIACLEVVGVPRERETGDFAFIAMAFRPELDFLYKDVFEPVLEERGLRAIRVDREEPEISLTVEILDLIKRAQVTIADLTFERPSIYYEVGYAHGIGCPVVLTARRDHNPFETPRDEGAPTVHFDLAVSKISYWSGGEIQALRDELASRLDRVLDRSSHATRAEELAPSHGVPLPRPQLEQFFVKRLAKGAVIEVVPTRRTPNEFSVVSLPHGEVKLRHIDSGDEVIIPDTAVVHVHRVAGQDRGVVHLSSPLEAFAPID